MISRGFGTGPRHPRLRMSGTYVLSEEHTVGFVKHMIDDANGEDNPAAGLRMVSIAKTAG